MLSKLKRGLRFIKKNGIIMTFRAVYVKLRQKYGGKTPLVSVIMPVYNVESYLEQTLESILNQTMKHFELIAVDDGSTDSSLEILKKYAAKDSRIQVLTQENQYAGVARNVGLAKAKGEYVIFLDSDDFFDKNLLKSAYYKGKLNRADIVLFGGKYFNEKTGKSWKAKGLLRGELVPAKQPFCFKDCPEKLYQMTTACPWTKLYRRKFVLNTGLKFQPLFNANDVFFVSSSLAMAERIVTVDKTLVNYRVGQTNNLQSSKKRFFYEALTAWHDKLIEIGRFEMLRQSYVNCALAGSLYNLRVVTDLEAKEEVFKLLKEKAFDSLELYGYAEEYYYNQEHYQDMMLVKNSSFEQYMSVKYGQQ